MSQEEAPERAQVSPRIPNEQRDDVIALTEAIKRNSALIDRQIQTARDWRLSLRNGLIAGFAGAVGATLLVSLALLVLKPFEKLDALGPMLQQIASKLQQPRAPR